MEFTIYCTSGKKVDYPGVKRIEGRMSNLYKIEINDFEDLKKIEEHFGDKLIISFRFKDIEIYDSYRE